MLALTTNSGKVAKYISRTNFVAFKDKLLVETNIFFVAFIDKLLIETNLLTEKRAKSNLVSQTETGYQSILILEKKIFKLDRACCFSLQFK